MFHHVNNGHQQQYFDLGKTQLYREVMGVDILSDNVRVITASTKTDYLSQVLFDYDLLVSTSVPHVGNKSMTVYQESVSHYARRKPLRAYEEHYGACGVRFRSPAVRTRTR
ncbi:MAG: hypothetical protein L6V35_07775 [Alistipes putredinis]|nr:MAG: hypothetical protein L6V35_07775 [Alistipes putredinis]